MADLIEAVGAPPYRDRAGLTELERSLSFEVDDLFSATDALNILRFADLKDGKLTLTSDGAQFAQLGTYERKALFAQHLLRYVPLAAHISDVLTKRGEHQAPRRRFQDELEDYVSHEAADATIQAIITWGRYAEFFTYDSRSRTFAQSKPPTNVSGA
jgi:NitT/TauT family transport system ATP-binding protein